jgi:signal transduction histidine kinase
MLRRLIGEDIQLMTVLDEQLSAVRADPGQMDQVLMNLAVNARDAMPRGGRLTIETGNVVLDQAYARQHAGVEPGHYVMLAVSDTAAELARRVRDVLDQPAGK